MTRALPHDGSCGVDVFINRRFFRNGMSKATPQPTVTVAEIVYHTSSVARGNKTALLIADMPFGVMPTPQVLSTMLCN